MTPDLDEIRAALAAATPAPWTLSREIRRWLNDADSTVVANAPTWLAALCAECERLRRIEYAVSNERLVAERDEAWAELSGCNHTVIRQIAELAKAQTEIERLQSLYEVDEYSILRLVAERDTALAEIRQFKEMWTHADIRRHAWRECADRLAAHVHCWEPVECMVDGGGDLGYRDCGRCPDCEALAAHDALKAGES